MAHPPRGSPPQMGVPHGGPKGHPGLGPPPNGPHGMAPQHPVGVEHPSLQPEGPPEKTYPCGCAWPGTHKPDCMWSLWEQMRDNYLKTRELMNKFMTQANTMQEATRENVKCSCPAGCHGTDLGKAMGLQQMTGVTVPWGAALGMGGAPDGMGGAPGDMCGAPMGGMPLQNYSVENEARKLMEEQKRIKSMWVQFLSIFDMALDMANDVSKDRWEQNRRRKERQRLEREQRLEEMRKERLERQKGSKPEPPPEKDKAANEKADDEGKGKDKAKEEQKKEGRPPTPADTGKDEAQGEEEAPAAEEEAAAAEEADEAPADAPAEPPPEQALEEP